MELDPKQTTAEFWKSYFAKFRRPMDADAVPAHAAHASAMQAAPRTDVPAEPRRMRRQRVTLASRQPPVTPEASAPQEAQER